MRTGNCTRETWYIDSLLPFFLPVFPPSRFFLLRWGHIYHLGSELGLEVASGGREGGRKNDDYCVDLLAVSSAEAERSTTLAANTFAGEGYWGQNCLIMYKSDYFVPPLPILRFFRCRWCRYLLQSLPCAWFISRWEIAQTGSAYTGNVSTRHK